jgi:hypothetical protein
MARQGNYVPISNINANWSGDLSKTLGTLGTQYANLATEEKKAAERLAERDENKRRFEQGRLDTAARNAVLDARAEQTRQDALVKWLSEQEESKRRWDIGNTRDQTIHDQKVTTFGRETDEYNRTLNNRNVLDNLDVGWGSEDLGPNVQNRIETAQNWITSTAAEIDKNAAAINERRNFLTPEGRLSPAGKVEYDARFNSYMDMYGDANKAGELAKADITTMRDNALANNYETRAREQLAGVQERLDKELSLLPYRGSIEEYIAAGIAEAKEAGYKNPNSAELREYLRGQAKDLGLKSRADIIAAGQTAATTAYDKRVKQIELLKKFYDARSAAGKSSSTTSKGMSASDFMGQINELDIFGDDEKQQAVDLFTTLSDPSNTLAQGISPGILREAIILTAANSVIGEDSTLDPKDPEDLAKVMEVAQALNRGAYSGKGYRIDKDDFTVGDIPSYSADELLGRRFDLKVPNTLVTPSRELLARPDVAAFKAKQEAELKAKEEAAAKAAEQAKADAAQQAEWAPLKAQIDQQRMDIREAQKDGLTVQEQNDLRTKYGTQWGFDKDGRSVLNYKYPWEK